MRHYTVRLTPFTTLSGGEAGPYRISGSDDFTPQDAVDAALHTWAPDRRVTEVIEVDSMFDDEADGVTHVEGTDWTQPDDTSNVVRLHRLQQHNWF